MEVPSPAGETLRLIESEVVIEAEKAEAEFVVRFDECKIVAMSSPSTARNEFVFLFIWLNTPLLVYVMTLSVFSIWRLWLKVKGFVLNWALLGTFQIEKTGLLTCYYNLWVAIVIISGLELSQSLGQICHNLWILWYRAKHRVSGKQSRLSPRR